MNKKEMLEDVERITAIIKKAEIESAKSEGVIADIKKEWKKEYGTDNVDEIKEKLSELEKDYKSKEQHLEALYDKLIASNDWDSLEEELGGYDD